MSSFICCFFTTFLPEGVLNLGNLRLQSLYLRLETHIFLHHLWNPKWASILQYFLTFVYIIHQFFEALAIDSVSSSLVYLIAEGLGLL